MVTFCTSLILKFGVQTVTFLSKIGRGRGKVAYFAGIKSNAAFERQSS